MTLSRARERDLGQTLVVVIIPLGLLHHADHVGRADHSSWPFRSELGPFTFTLLIYPVLVLAFAAPKGQWLRAGPRDRGRLRFRRAHAHRAAGADLRNLGQQPQHRSAALRVDPQHVHNLFDRYLPLLGNLATTLSIVLTGCCSSPRSSPSAMPGQGPAATAPPN